MDSSEPVSESDPLYCLKHFIRDLMYKIETLHAIQALLANFNNPTRLLPTHPIGISLHRHLNIHRNYLSETSAVLENLVLQLQLINQRLLTRTIAFNRWELLESTLNEEDIEECSDQLYKLAQEAVDMDDQALADLKGMRQRLRQILRRAVEICTTIDDHCYLRGVGDVLEGVRAHMEQMGQE